MAACACKKQSEVQTAPALGGARVAPCQTTVRSCVLRHTRTGPLPSVPDELEWFFRRARKLRIRSHDKPKPKPKPQQRLRGRHREDLVVEVRDCSTPALRLALLSALAMHCGQET